jgi:hypothetical protein
MKLDLSSIALLLGSRLVPNFVPHRIRLGPFLGQNKKNLLKFRSLRFAALVLEHCGPPQPRAIGLWFVMYSQVQRRWLHMCNLGVPYF